MIGNVFPSWVERTANGTDAYIGRTFVALLLKSSYTFDGTDSFISDLSTSTNEVSGSSYARVVVSGTAVSRTGSLTTVTWNPITFPLLTATGAGAPWSMIIAMQGASDSASPLVLQQDFEAAAAASNEDVIITPSTDGFLQYASTP